MNRIASPAAPSILGIWPSSNPGIPSVNLKTASSGSSAHSDLSSQRCSTSTLLTHADIDISGRIGKQRCLSCTGTPSTTKLAKRNRVSEACVPITVQCGLTSVGICTIQPGLCVSPRYCPTLWQMLTPQQKHQEAFTTRCFKSLSHTEHPMLRAQAIADTDLYWWLIYPEEAFSVSMSVWMLHETPTHDAQWYPVVDVC